MLLDSDPVIDKPAKVPPVAVEDVGEVDVLMKYSSTVRDLLAARLPHIKGFAEVDADTSLRQIGVDSLTVVAVLVDLAEIAGFEIDKIAEFEEPPRLETIKHLCQLSEQLVSQPGDSKA